MWKLDIERGGFDLDSDRNANVASVFAFNIYIINAGIDLDLK